MATTTTEAPTSSRGIWEGLGGPIKVDDHRNLEEPMIDPTLDSCCQREIKRNVRSGAIRRTLQRHDIVGERERRRRNLVHGVGFEGCRCMYDPRVDGGEYSALSSLRRRQQQQQQDQEQPPRENNDDNEVTVSYVRRSAASTVEELYCVDIPNARKGDEETEHQKVNQEKSTIDEKDDDDDDEFDYLLDEDLPGQSEALKLLEEQRRVELENDMLQRETQLQHGYGVCRQMHPSRALKAAGLVQSNTSAAAAARRRDHNSSLVVVHLFDPHSIVSASLDLYLEELARRMRGTIFIRSEGRSTLILEEGLVQNGALPRLQADRDLPVLIAIKDGMVIQTSCGLQDFVDKSRHCRSMTAEEEDCIIPEAVYNWLDRLGILRDTPPSLDELCRIRPEEEVLMDYLVQDKGPKRRSAPQPEDFFQCGVEGCQKLFAHQHVGIETKEQSGLVVSESEIIGAKS